MRKKHAVAAAVVALALIACLAGSAQAVSVPLGTSGWQVTWQDPFLSVQVDFQTSGEVRIEKFVQFNDSTAFTDPGKSNITFEQIDVSAVPLIIINDETVVNKTGQAWGGFRFILESGADGTGTFTHWDPTNTFNPPDPGGFSIDPFTTATFGANTAGQANTVLTFGGGIVPSDTPGDDVWSPGGISGELRLLAEPVGAGFALRSFVLKEQPIALIPLPAAAWTGLSGLAGLGLLGSLKKMRKLVA